MSEFTWLCRGDRLPAVAVAQLLLKRTGFSLAADGDFGPATQAAVRSFQSQRRLGADGIIGRITWPRLVASERLQIIDCIDVFDPDLYDSEGSLLRGAGGRPMVLGGMCNGIEQAVTNIVAAANQTFLLRFHGHGASGVAGVSDGEGEITSRSSFENNPETMRALRRLRGVFGPWGCIQFMHCSTGSGPAGAAFLQKVANTVGVPATGALNSQYGSTLREAVRYEGPVRTACPGGTSVATWARGLPQFAQMSVA